METYPQLANADLVLAEEHSLLVTAELVGLDYAALERTSFYDPEDHGFALDFDKIRDELLRRGIVDKLDERFGVRDEIARSLDEAES